MVSDSLAGDSSGTTNGGHGCAPTIKLLTDLFAAAPTFAAILEGPDLVFRMANPPYEALVGRTGLVGQAARAVLPELETQGFVALLDRVLVSGEPYVGHHVPVRYHPDKAEPLAAIDRIRDFVYQPLVDERGRPWAVFVHGVDVTEQLQMHDQISARDLKLREAELELDDARRHQFNFLAGLARDLSNPESRLRQGVTAARRDANPEHIETVSMALDRQWAQLLHAVRMQLDALGKTLQNFG
jgi:signal transduction histidine kinase